MPFKFNPLSGSLDYYSTPIQLPPTDPTNPETSSNGLIIQDGVIQLTLASETTAGTITAQDYTEFKTKKEYKTFFDNIILTTEQVADKKITLTNLPVFPETTMLTLEGGALQRYGVDYTIIDQELSWNDLGLDNFLEPGDALQIYYQTE